MSIECLAVMFAGCMNYQPVQSYSPPVLSAVNRVEMASRMAGLNQAQTDYVYAVFGDETAKSRLVNHVRVWLSGIAVNENWRIERGRPIVHGMGSIAVIDFMSVQKYTGRMIANKLGMDEASFRRTWRQRYDRAIKYMQGIDSHVNSVIRRSRMETLIIDQ